MTQNNRQVWRWPIMAAAVAIATLCATSAGAETRVVRIAIAASNVQASTPYAASQTNTPSQPASSATTASSSCSAKTRRARASSARLSVSRGHWPG